MNKKTAFLFCLLSGIIFVLFFRTDITKHNTRIINTNTSSNSPYKQSLLNITQTTPNTWKVILPADVLWVETPIDVSDKTVKITRIGGNWTNDKNGTTTYITGNGWPPGFDGQKQLPVPQANLGALVGRVGNKTFSIGDKYLGKLGKGTLELSMNDLENNFGDNDGYLELIIQLN